MILCVTELQKPIYEQGLHGSKTLKVTFELGKHLVAILLCTHHVPDTAFTELMV